MLGLGLASLTGVFGGARVPQPATLLTTTTTSTTVAAPRTSTSIAILNAAGTPKRVVLAFVTVPDVLGLTLGQADGLLSEVGLSGDVATLGTHPSGEAPTGTVVAQTPAAGSQAQTRSVIQLTVSGY